MTLTFRAHVRDTNLTIDSPLEPFWFPGGEPHIKNVDKQVGDFDYQIADLRGADPRDMFMLAMWSQVVMERGEKMVLFLPYLPAARADRGVPDLSGYTQFIADQVLPDQIIYIDPHSPEWRRSLFEFAEFNGKATEFPFERIIRHKIQDKTSDSRPQPYAGVIAPDKGAHDRASRAARVMGVPVYTAGKTRDFETGKLTGFHMEDELPAEGKFLIVDDICDGGGTFIGLAQAIGLPYDRLDLWVTHGIFSKMSALQTMLDETFGVVHTTNSYPSPAMDSPNVQRRLGSKIIVHDILPYFTEAIDV
jgi:ribose-phosphate pyrophosphokinase